MQRYFVVLENWSDERVVIIGEDVHHISRVMRNNVGDKVKCIHPNGTAAICEIVELSLEKASLSIISREADNYELPINVTIAQGIPKGTKLELILQKTTELGVRNVQLFQADRSISKWDAEKSDSKLKRYSKILKEASEQSYRNFVPSVLEPKPLEQLLKSYADYDLILYAYEEAAKSTAYHSLNRALSPLSEGNEMVIFIGPEGGFSEREVALFQQYNARAVRLGKRILRTETASLYALAAISYHFEEQID